VGSLTDRLILFRKIIFIYYENHTKHIGLNAVCWQNTVIFNVNSHKHGVRGSVAG
jgi:hypothetical protein